ncbi:hypothetical protein DYBT9275_00705 [Dyadobacter sp. CECT 9275]|uniref:DivIVA domain-containing protein n=1 Tax=Dyadobacter helix TaxID=2822344 RepID=A0A916J7M4_9BACT|nr:DivIVA domain-containing protein [Dyadobacter sp. CECT 9275]CAG4991216.1 hypothetical protein DYBT9275_00705 [Dyadobacter sp. CECT 9275]
MKISAIDIRKHTFEKIFRGYDPDAVDAFLNSLSQEWERYTSENNLLKMQLEYAEKELAKLKDIETTLFRTLKTAEDASRQIEKEATAAADKRIDESKVRSDEMIAEAEARTNQIIRETEEKLKRFKEEFAAEIKLQERDFRAIENFRDNLVVQLSSLANNTMDTVERFEQKYDKESVLNRMEEIRQHVSEIEIPKKAAYFTAPKEETAAVEPDPIVEEQKNEVVLEIVAPEHPAEEEKEMEPEETVVIPEPAYKAPEPVISEIAIPIENRKKTAAEEANEALEEMHRSAEKARDASPAINRPRTPDTSTPKKNGGGSFFDQI